jgi:hypothetical protein
MKLTARMKTDLSYLIGTPGRPRGKVEETRWAILEAAGYIKQVDGGRREVTPAGQTAYAAACLSERERRAFQSLADNQEHAEHTIHGVGEATFASLANRKYITRCDRSLRMDGRYYCAAITARGRELLDVDAQ